jgi:hypothetical protein
VYLDEIGWLAVEDPVGVMPKRNRVPAPQKTPNLGQEAVQEGDRGTAMPPAPPSTEVVEAAAIAGPVELVPEVRRSRR